MTMQTFTKFDCRKCGKENPIVYFSPISEAKTCICYDCADERQWIDANGDLKEGIFL